MEARHSEVRSLKGQSSEGGEQGDMRHCFRCSGPHLICSCSHRIKEVCWTCGEQGHFSADCPSSRRTAGNE